MPELVGAAAWRLTHLVGNATMIRAAPALATRQW